MNDLIIPETPESLPERFAARLCDQLATLDSVDAVEECRRRVAALCAYVTRREHKQELEAAQRWCEVRIGELLGPGGEAMRRGKADPSPAGEGSIPREDRHRFRLLAAHRDFVAERIAAGTVHRSRLLQQIAAMRRLNGKAATGRHATNRPAADGAGANGTPPRRAGKPPDEPAGAEEAGAEPAGAEEGAAWRVVEGDCLAELPKLRAGCARLVFADPPYNVGMDYGGGAKADRRPDDEYLADCRRCFEECRRVLADDGSLWVLIGDEYAAEYGVMLKGLGLTIRGWIKWHETFGVCNSAKRGFSRCSRHLFYFAKDARRFVFNPEAVSRPSDRQTKYNDARADPTGKVWDDVWVIPRLTGTCAERLPEFPTQLPLDLLRPVILCASDPGDLVIDPYSGSATTGVAALESGRRYLGVERGPNFARLSRLRLRGVTP
jgi:site-specific DNA-methyltransferase (adenine-specific)